MSDNGERALALASLGLHVFPCWESGDSLKSPRTEHGFLEATNDPEQIRQWWAAAPEALIGVAAGASGLVCMDIDHKPEKDGWASLTAAGLQPTLTTYWYETASGGHHLVYAAPPHVPGPTQNHKLEDGRRLAGVDRRSGGSYFIWWDEAWPDSRDEFAVAPEWFMNHTGTEGEGWGGTLGEWLSTVGAGRMSGLVKSALAKIPREDFGRGELWSRMVHLIRLATVEGEPGVGEALEVLRQEWLRDPWNQPKYQREWVVSLGNAVQANGGIRPRVEVAVEQRIAILDYSWFDRTPQLRHIRQWAQSQLINPWAALLVVLTRLSADLPPHVMLPRIGGLPKGSLNQFSILAGPSGAGKSALMTGVDENLWPRPPFRHDPAQRFTPSSGEGLITRFVQRRRREGEWVDERVAYQALAMLDEIDAMDTLASRNGNMLLSILKTLWTGGAFGTANASEDRNRTLEAHTYRLAMMVGVQPGLGRVLFEKDGVTGGLPQRFVFANVADPTLTLESPFVDDPGRLSLPIAEAIPMDPIIHGTQTHMPRDGEHFYVMLEPEIVAEILQAQREIKMQLTDPLKGHWLFAKLRITALLSIAHGGTMVTNEWWAAAEQIMAHSDATRAELMRSYSRSLNAENIAKGRGDAERVLAADNAIIWRASDRILDILRVTPNLSLGEIVTRMSKAMRDNADAAIAQLVDQGRITATATGKVRKSKEVYRYSLSE